LRISRDAKTEGAAAPAWVEGKGTRTKLERKMKASGVMATWTALEPPKNSSMEAN